MAGFDVVFACSETGKAIHTGIELPHIEAFDAAQLSGGIVSCSHCGQRHAWTPRDVWLHATPDAPRLPLSGTADLSAHR